MQIKDNLTRHAEVLHELMDIYEAKNTDYGDSFSKIYQKFGLLSTVIRLTDKINRLETLIQKEAMVNESIEDTLIDIANYSIMTVMEIRANNYTAAAKDNIETRAAESAKTIMDNDIEEHILKKCKNCRRYCINHDTGKGYCLLDGSEREENGTCYAWEAK